MRQLKTYLLVVFVVVPAVVTAQPDDVPEDVGLFKAVVKAARAAEARLIAPAVRWREVTIDHDRLSSSSEILELNLFKGTHYYSIVSGQRETSDGVLVITGYLRHAAEVSDVTLAVKGKSVVGTVNTFGEAYRIRPIDWGSLPDSHVVTEINLGALPPGGRSLSLCGAGSEQQLCSGLER